LVGVDLKALSAQIGYKKYVVVTQLIITIKLKVLLVWSAYVLSYCSATTGLKIYD